MKGPLFCVYKLWVRKKIVGNKIFFEKKRTNKPNGSLIWSKTERKEDPAQVANDMRNARNTGGTQMFNR